MRIVGLPTRRRGNAVLLVVLLIPILVFLARSLAWLSSTSHFRSLNHRQQIAGTYVMEAGLAHAAAMLTEDATWEEGFDEERMTRTNGTYTITFQSNGTSYSEGNSVNNIFGSEERDGPRGPDTVVPGTAELVIHSRNGSSQSSGTFLMQAVFDNNSDWAVSSGGHIRMEGNVDVQGVENLASWAESDAGIHANVYQDQDPAISWRPSELGDKATFTGRVSTPSRGERALDFAGTEGVDYTAAAFEDGVGRLAIPTPDIIQEVAGHSSAPAVPVNPFGTTRLAGGDYYSGGDLDLQGDLVLDSGILFVSGSLNVNGSISGTGSVYVTGKTVFKGDAYIESGAEGVALYSEGSISMTGFNGTEYMNRLAQDFPEIQQNYAIAKSELFESSDSTPDATQREHNNRAQASIARVRDIVLRELPGGSTTADFIREQLTAFYDVIEVTHEDGTYSRAEMGEVYREIRYGLDRVGTGYFKGLLVSNSYIHTESSVAVVGAMWATGTNESDPPITVDGVIVEPGDIQLGDDTSVLLDKELVDDDESNAPTRLKGLEMLAWRNN